ncbi:hypothetical protein ACFLWO_00600 [Chloroflexota bacterium]
MPNKKSEGFPNFHSNDNLPVLHVDSASVSSRDDKIVLLNFTTSLPHGEFEQSRMMIREDDLHQVISLMCDTINYYPKKTSGKSNSPKNKK